MSYESHAWGKAIDVAWHIRKLELKGTATQYQRRRLQQLYKEHWRLRAVIEDRERLQPNV